MTRLQTDMVQFVLLNYIPPSLNFIRYKLLTLSKLMVLRVAQASPKVAFHRVLIIYAWENLKGCIPWSIVSFSRIVKVWLPSITGLSLSASFLGVLHPSPGGSFFPALLRVLFLRLGFLFLSSQLALHFSIFFSSLIVGRNSKPPLPPRPRWPLLSLLSSSKSWASFSAIWIWNFSSHALLTSSFQIPVQFSFAPCLVQIVPVLVLALILTFSFRYPFLNLLISIVSKKALISSDLTDFPLVLVFFICV